MQRTGVIVVAGLLSAGLAAGCGDQQDDRLHQGSGGGDGGGEASPCPAGMIYMTQNRVELGEWELDLLETYTGNVIPEQSTSTDPACVARFPMPGIEGADWPLDGLSLDQLPAVEEALALYGRRLCTVPELLLGAAGEENWRHPYDPEERAADRCDPDDFNPQPLGTYSACESPMGLRDVEVRSTWALLDEQTRDALADVWGDTIPGDGVYAVWGGTSRADTYYAPSNFGVHFHGEGEDPYTDDALRVCADPGVPTAEQDEAWAQAMQALIEVGSFAEWLATR